MSRAFPSVQRRPAQGVITRCGLLLATLHLTGCAGLPPDHEPHPQDRLERYNRAMYRFNDGVDRAIVRPAANAYTTVTPVRIRTGVGNFFENISYTTTIANDLLQWKLKPMATDTLRLLVNTTLGIGGLFDPATPLGIPAGNEDLGQTLGRWGVPAGPYLVLPLFGPSTVRDATGHGVDRTFTDLMQYVSSSSVRYGLTAVDVVHRRSELLPLQNTIDKAFDPYAFIRNAYLQRREYQIKDGNVPEDVGESWSVEPPQR